MDALTSKHREAVLWGCREHRTPAGTPCRHCCDQGELFPRSRSATTAGGRR